MTPPTRLAVGWCHSCGTLQLKDEMPISKLPWADGPEPVCINDWGETWGMGVWPKGKHLPDCPTVELARALDVDWTPSLSECTCNVAATSEEELETRGAQEVADPRA